MDDPIEEAITQERRRCLDLHKMCREGACPNLFRDLVKRGVNTDEANTEIEHLLAHRGR